MADVPLSTFFNKGASQAASQITDWILAGMESFIPAKKYQLKPNSQPWFTPECATAIAHRNHFFQAYQRNRSNENHGAFRKAANHCHRVLEVARASYTLATQTRIGKEQLGSRKS